MLGLAVLKAHHRFNEQGDWVPAAGQVELREKPSMSSAVSELVGPNELLGEEHDYEAPAALVVARVSGWYGVARRVGGRSLLRWIPERDVVRFRPLSELLAAGSYLTLAWPGRFYAAPEGASVGVPAGAGFDEGRPVIEVVAVEPRQSGLWLVVDVLDRPHCQGERGRRVARVNVPALAPDGRPNVWFWSRGC